MAVVLHEGVYYSIDTLRFFNCAQYAKGSKGLSNTYTLRPSLFDVSSQYEMNSAYAARAGVVTDTDTDTSTLKTQRKKRKQKHLVPVSGVVEVDEEVCKAISCAKSSGLFFEDVTKQDNNKTALELVESLGCGELLCQLTAMPHDHSLCLDDIVFDSQQDIPSQQHCLFHSIVRVTSPVYLTVNIHDRKFLLCPNSTFIMSDVTGLHTFSRSLSVSEKFDFIVADPPWENKSIKRKRLYNMLTNYDIMKLPVKHLASDKAILALWCTNKKSLHDFIKSKVLPGWGFKLVSVWYWCKVTKAGLPVRPFEQGCKKTYESIFIAVRNNLDVPKDLTDTSFLVSVPSLIHSSKPPLIDIFRKYLVSEPKRLELFARNLLPNFTSWGNEVLRHQDMDYYEVKMTDSEISSSE